MYIQEQHSSNFSNKKKKVPIMIGHKLHGETISCTDSITIQKPAKDRKWKVGIKLKYQRLWWIWTSFFAVEKTPFSIQAPSHSEHKRVLNALEFSCFLKWQSISGHIGGAHHLWASALHLWPGTVPFLGWRICCNTQNQMQQRKNRFFFFLFYLQWHLSLTNSWWWMLTPQYWPQLICPAFKIPSGCI